MITIAEFSIPTESFALAETLPEYPAVAVEADRIAAHAPTTTMPCLWATVGDTSAFAEALATDRTVKSVQQAVDFEGEWLFHIIWTDEVDDLVAEMIDHEGVILEASGRGSEWRVRLRFMSREQFVAFQRFFEDHEASFTLEELFTAKFPRHTRGDVTPEQTEALVTATELGYFNIPRTNNARDVATVLGISDQAFSERIRRGTENLVRDMLKVEPIQDRE